MSTATNNEALRSPERFAYIDGSRSRRYSANVARRRYYAASRAKRFAKRFGLTASPEKPCRFA